MVVCNYCFHSLSEMRGQSEEQEREVEEIRVSLHNSTEQKGVLKKRGKYLLAFGQIIDDITRYFEKVEERKGGCCTEEHKLLFLTLMNVHLA